MLLSLRGEAGPRVVAVVSSALLVLGLALIPILSYAPGQADALTSGGTFVPLPPTRLLDTRTGNGLPASAPARLPATSGIPLAVAGRGGVPASGVAAVVLNITVVGADVAGPLTVYPYGAALPVTSNLNFYPGEVVPNLVITGVSSTGGKVEIYNNSAGSLDVLADVSGYYTTGSPTADGAFVPLPAPHRLLDTRTGTGAPQARLGSLQQIKLKVTGAAGVPSTGISAVVLNVTAVNADAAGPLTVYPSGVPLPATSNLNFYAGEVVPNLVIAPVGTDGFINLYNDSAGSVDVLADVSGYFRGTSATTPGAYTPLSPSRLLDTRTGNGAPAARLPATTGITLHVTGRGGVPTTGISAVVLNVTAVGSDVAGPLTVFGNGSVPVTSSLNFYAGEVVPNLVLTPVAPDGTVQLYNNSAGSLDVVADVMGYVRTTTLSVPVASNSRYVRNLAGSNESTSGNAALMHNEGCTDAQSSTSATASLQLLDIGAQTITAPLSAATPGVALSATSTRLSYPDLVAALDGYVDGYASCQSTTQTVQIGLGTNNDGDFSAYLASARGTDWANSVVAQVRTHAASHPRMTVLGANDIEADFASTEAQAEQWITAYLGATSGNLIFMGAASGCPTIYGTTGQVCTASGGWTQLQYYRLAHALAPGRIEAVPQIYTPALAVQWANIDLTGATGGDQINFIGALTENAACGSCSLAPAVAFVALADALSGNALTQPTALQYSTDLQIS